MCNWHPAIRRVALPLLCVVEESWTLGRPSTVALQPELRSAVNLSLMKVQVLMLAQQIMLRTIAWAPLIILEIKRADREKLAATKCKASSATRMLIAASYPPCVTFHFPWHNSTDAASSSSCRATIDDSHKVFVAPIQVHNTNRSLDASCTCCVGKVQSIFISGIKSYSVVPVFRSSVILCFPVSPLFCLITSSISSLPAKAGCSNQVSMASS